MIDTESGRAQTLRFAIDLVVRLTLLAGIVYGSLLLLSPIAGMLLWSVILAVAAHPLFALLAGACICTTPWPPPCCRS